MFGAVVDARLVGVVGIRRHCTQGEPSYIWGIVCGTRVATQRCRGDSASRQRSTKLAQMALGLLQVQLTNHGSRSRSRGLYTTRPTRFIRNLGREPRGLSWNGACSRINIILCWIRSISQPANNASDGGGRGRVLGRSVIATPAALEAGVVATRTEGRREYFRCWHLPLITYQPRLSSSVSQAFGRYGLQGFRFDGYRAKRAARTSVLHVPGFQKRSAASLAYVRVYGSAIQRGFKFWWLCIHKRGRSAVGFPQSGREVF